MRLNTSALFAATVALLSGTILIGHSMADRVPEPLERPLEEIGSLIDEWNVTDERRLDARVLKSLTPTSYLSRTYRKGTDDLDLFIAFYAQQRAGESMHSPKHCLPGSGWEIWRHDSAMIPVNGSQVEVNKYSIQNNGTRMLMFYWYQSKNRIIANEYLGKLMLARDTLLTGRSGGSIVRVLVMDNKDAEQQGVAFAAKLIPQVQRCFGSLSANSPLLGAL
jgi:EpsI family protein